MLGARLPRLHLVLPGLRKLLEGAASPVCIPRRELSPGSVIGIDAMKVMLDYVKIPKDNQIICADVALDIDNEQKLFNLIYDKKG